MSDETSRATLGTFFDAVPPCNFCDNFFMTIKARVRILFMRKARIPFRSADRRRWLNDI